MGINDLAASAVGYDFLWSFGGGTAMMLQIDHRESHDIDLFIDDPQILPFLNPVTQGYTLNRQPDDYDTDGSHVVKLVFANVGEIDYICCAEITENPSVKTNVQGRMVYLETPAEIVAKKVYYRGSRLQPRDMFDLAAVANALGADYVAGALRHCGTERLRSAQELVHKADPDFVKQVISQLMLRDQTRPLIDTAQAVTGELIEEALKA